MGADQQCLLFTQWLLSPQRGLRVGWGGLDLASKERVTDVAAAAVGSAFLGGWICCRCVSCHLKQLPHLASWVSQLCACAPSRHCCLPSSPQGCLRSLTLTQPHAYQSCSLTGKVLHVCLITPHQTFQASPRLRWQALLSSLASSHSHTCPPNLFPPFTLTGENNRKGELSLTAGCTCTQEC